MGPFGPGEANPPVSGDSEYGWRKPPKINTEPIYLGNYYLDEPGAAEHVAKIAQQGIQKLKVGRTHRAPGEDFDQTTVKFLSGNQWYEWDADLDLNREDESRAEAKQEIVEALKENADIAT